MTRFDLDMDGSMEPSEHGRWVRYEDAQRQARSADTWVGLTDEEISKMPAWIYSPDQDGMTAEEGLEVFARAIEAKLKEKNT